MTRNFTDEASARQAVRIRLNEPAAFCFAPTHVEMNGFLVGAVTLEGVCDPHARHFMIAPDCGRPASLDTGLCLPP